jgi:hypothetical protein
MPGKLEHGPAPTCCVAVANQSHSYAQYGFETVTTPETWPFGLSVLEMLALGDGTVYGT